jgi:hypothetical protein
MLDPDSNVKPPADRSVWQFSLGQCLVAVAMVAAVCGAYQYNPLLGWLTSILVIAPAVCVLNVRGIILPAIFGALLGGIAAAAPVVAIWSHHGPPDTRMMIIDLLLSPTMGATLGIAMNLFKQRRAAEGTLVFSLVYPEMAIAALFVPAIR